MPAAVITIGMMIGEIRIAIMAVLPRKSARLRPSAASVPRVVATRVAKMPTMMLFFRPSSHWSLVKNSSYQRRL